MLNPHPTSFLYFAVQCQRVQEEEEAEFPSYLGPIDPAVLDRFDLNAAEVAFFARHQDRCGVRHELATKWAAMDLQEILGTPEDEVPPLLLTAFAERTEICWQLQDYCKALSAGQVGGTSSVAPAGANIAQRERVARTLSGLYLGRGNVNFTRAAELARDGMPRSVNDGKAQFHHVRDAIKRYAKPVRRCSPTWRDLLVRALATDAIIKVRHAKLAWDKLRAQPHYRASEHVDHVEKVISSGLLMQWLHSFADGIGNQQAYDIATNRFALYLIDQELAALDKEVRRRGLGVSSPATGLSKRKHAGRSLKAPSLIRIAPR
jgi:hypothetical protein